MTTRRSVLRLAPGLLALGGIGLAGCVAYPVSPAYPPTMVWMPSLGAYVAVDYSYPLFYYSGIYYYSYAGRWYSGPRYGGPWQPIGGPPAPLRTFRAPAWHDYQARARGYYQASPNWRHFRAGR